MHYGRLNLGDPASSYAPPAGTSALPGAGPTPLLDLLPGIGTAVGNVIGSAKSPIQRAAEYQGELQSAIARGASISVINNWRNKLAGAKYEVEQQKQWDAQQQNVLFGVQALQATAVVVGASMILYFVSKSVRR